MVAQARWQGRTREAAEAMSGVKHKRKGSRIEREIVQRHEEAGIHAERIPLSGAARFRGDGHDVDVYAFGVDEAPLVAEVKGRKSADGFRMLERWLGDYDLLFLRRDRDTPLAVLPWRVWERILRELCDGRRDHKKLLPDAISGRRAVREEGGSNGKVDRENAR